jgi:hypothetical protein
MLLDSITQLSLFDKALFLHQYGKQIESYKENNLKYTVYLLDGYTAIMIYNITNSQIEEVIVQKTASENNNL